MSISVGGIDLVSSTITTELRIAVLERIVDHLLKNTGLTRMLAQKDIDQIRNEELEKLKAKYPQAGIQLG